METKKDVAHDNFENQDCPSKEYGGKANNFDMLELFLALQDNGNQAIESSEKQITSFLERCGLSPEKLSHEDQSEARQKMRFEHYHNIHSLLTRYRSLRRTYSMFKEMFAETVLTERNVDPREVQGKGALFKTLSTQLELMAAQEEKRFEAIYAPYITAGKKIEYAIDALHIGLRVLKNEDKDLHDLLYFTYIEGDRTPKVEEILEKFGYCSPSTYYKRRKIAEERLTTCTFGFTSNRAELSAVLSYLRQQTETDYFPDNDDKRD